MVMHPRTSKISADDWLKRHFQMFRPCLCLEITKVRERAQTELILHVGLDGHHTTCQPICNLHLSVLASGSSGSKARREIMR